MAHKRDNLHFSTREIDGYQKAFNFIISEREDGKSTEIWLTKVYKMFKKKNRPSLVIRRLINDITDIYINDIAEILNKFTDDNVIFTYKKGSFKEGIVDVKINDKIFIRVIALSNPLSRIKSLILRDIAYVIFDEFICNTRMGEKYLPDEAFKFKELYNTFQRETTQLKCYFLGNPYSLYNPYFVWIGVDTSKLKRGVILSGSNWVVQCHELNPKLKEAILKKNPLYEFDDSYTRYAFDGLNINDMNIRVLPKRPSQYTLRYALRVEGKSLGVYENLDYSDIDNRFWCGIIDDISARKRTYCVDFNDLVNRTTLISSEIKYQFRNFKIAFNNRQVDFESISCYYLVENIYPNI